jgi:hypothetical protein
VERRESAGRVGMRESLRGRRASLKGGGRGSRKREVSREGRKMRSERE